MDLTHVNIESYLSSRHIYVSDSGKNVSDGWIGIECPFCPDGDPSQHLGINLDTKGISCWRCDTTGTIIKLVMALEHVNAESAVTTLNKFSDKKIYVTTKKSKDRALLEREPISKYKLLLENDLAIAHRQWLEKRNFNPEEIYNKYKLKCFGPIGDFKLRLMIPFYRRATFLTFSTRDITDLSDTPYIHCPIEQSLVDAKRYLYNLDTVSDTVIVVEGFTDVWRIGDGCVSTQGIKYVVEQLFLLRNVKRAFFMYDSEKFAIEAAEKAARAASTFIPHVEIYELSEGDPADMTEGDVKSLRKTIFGKVY